MRTNWRPSYPSRSWPALFAALVAALVLFCLSAPPVAAAAAGSMEIINPATSYPLNSGGSGTRFGVTVPTGARCPGDSAHAGFHVITYAVPTGIDPGSVHLYALLPTKGVPLTSYEAGPYEAKNTAVDTGEVGQLANDFVWQRYTPRQLMGSASRAVWTAVVACAAPNGSVTTYWTVQVGFHASTGDPHGFAWAVTKPLHKPNGSKAWAYVLIGLAVVAGGVWWVTGRSSKRRRTSQGPDPREDAHVVAEAAR